MTLTVANKNYNEPRCHTVEMYASAIIVFTHLYTTLTFDL